METVKTFYVTLSTNNNTVDYIVNLKSNVLRSLRDTYQNSCFQDQNIT